MRTSRSLFGAALLLALAGCAGDEGVVVPIVVTYLPLDGKAVEQPLDVEVKYDEMTIFTGEGPRAREFPAVYDATQVEFAGVPEGKYTLRVQYPAHPTLPQRPGYVYHMQTAARELEDLAEVHSGRGGVESTADLDTALLLSATGVRPLAAEDVFELYSYNADVLAYRVSSFDPQDGASSPAEGATTLAGWRVPWRPFSTRRSWPLIDAGQGDDLWLAQLRGRQLVPAPDAAQARDPWSYARVLTLTDAAELSLPAMTGGAATPASGAFKPVATRSVTVDLRMTDFLALLASYSGALISTSCRVSVLLEPGVERPVNGVTAYLGGVAVSSKWLPVDPACPADACDPAQCSSCDEFFALPGDHVFELEYGNPFSGGTEVLEVVCALTTFSTDPKTGEYEQLVAWTGVVGRLDELTRGAVVPRMAPVGDLRVNGEVIRPDTLRGGVGTTPTITFTPPVEGEPDVYRVDVYALEDAEDAEGQVLGQRLRASIDTEDTSVTIPDGLLRPGAYYYFQVHARRGHVLGTAGAYTHDMYRASAITGMIAP